MIFFSQKIKDRFCANSMVLEFILFTFWVRDLCVRSAPLLADCAMIFLKVRKSISVLTLSQQWESLSLASEVIKKKCCSCCSCFLWPRFIKLHKSNNGIRPWGRKSVSTTPVIRASVLMITSRLCRDVFFVSVGFPKLGLLMEVYSLI